MEVKRRSQADRTASTRAALIAGARALFADRGYADVSTPELASAAGVTRGALYHQFGDKQGLFLAVVNAVEADVTARLAQQVAASGATDPASALHAAVDAWLDACEDPEVRRVLLVEAPAVLGWEALRDVALDHGLGLTEALLQAAVDAGTLERQPLRPLAHLLIGALDEAALYVEGGGDRGETAAALHRVLDGLLTASG
jgi:AcrR family transcriptional regulator